MEASPFSALDLPAPIASFFSQEASDPTAGIRCFSDDAVVIDEGREHHGRAAIGRWHADAVTRRSVVSEPLAAETVGLRTTVTARVTGNFTGSPIRLHFRFIVADELITRLEIAP